MTAAYDPADGYTVLYGGYNANTVGNFTDTWTYVGGNWTQLSPSHHPTASVGLTLAYDPTLHGVLTFGGQYSAPDTWLFKAGAWTQIKTAADPPASFGYAMAYDPAAQKMVLFGGQAGNNSNTFLADTWTFNGTAWTHVTPSVHPGSRIGGKFVYDAAIASLLLVGGRDGTSSGGQFGTWAFHAGTWQNLTGANTPAPRNFPLVTTLGNGTTILTGGSNPPTSAFYNTTWEFYAGAWHEVFPANSPSPRGNGAFSWDGADRYILMFGGSFQNRFGSVVDSGQTWVFT